MCCIQYTPEDLNHTPPPLGLDHTERGVLLTIRPLHSVIDILVAVGLNAESVGNLIVDNSDYWISEDSPVK